MPVDLLRQCPQVAKNSSCAMDAGESEKSAQFRFMCKALVSVLSEVNLSFGFQTYSFGKEWRTSLFLLFLVSSLPNVMWTK